MQNYILNIWYMIAWSEEVTEALMSRKVLGKAVLITRDENGDAVALRDFCPHRFAPLSKGRREGNRIVCGYHGLNFNTQGICVHNPYSDRIPATANVDCYPVCERDGIVWVWFGDPAYADPASVPDFSPTLPGPNGSRVAGYTFMQANYEYGTDNLLDLSHIEFLHTGTFAGRGVIFKGTHSVKQDGDRLHSNWWIPGVDRPHGFEFAVQEKIVDHWLDMRWDSPASMYLQIGATGQGQSREAGGKFDQAHILTPADVGETHYFWSNAVPFQLPREAAEGFREMLRVAFDVEDKPMIEAAYANSDGAFWEHKPLSLGIDAGGTRARRIIEGLKRAEAAAPPEKTDVLAST
jgi:phenylpropionate dioxygenase-like ring-hydroxylating dioxygenase large terminal subunit